MVDTIEDVIEVAQNMFEPSPHPQSGDASHGAGATRWQAAVMLLDLEPILNLNGRCQ